MEFVYEQMEIYLREKMLAAMKASSHGKDYEGNVFPDKYFCIRITRNEGHMYGNDGEIVHGEIITGRGIYGNPFSYGIGYYDIRMTCAVVGKGLGDMKAKAKKQDFVLKFEF